MNHHSPILRRLLLAMACAALLITGAGAQELAAEETLQFCFAADDFAAECAGGGIFLTQVPHKAVAAVYCGDRLLQAGDAICYDDLSQLWVETLCTEEQSAAIGYYPVAGGHAGTAQELRFSVLPRKNDPPTARDSTLETYRNIPNTGELLAEDPENGQLTYALVQPPKRGTVELHEDGTFTYTPKENKVGKDSFTFTVTDDAGQTSDPARVSIEIKKPSDKAVYEDLTDDADGFYATWMRETGLYSGSTVGGHLCFEPEEAVSRGEFLVMAMKLVQAEADTTQLHSGFADEADTPVWMQPYIVSALNSGMISGSQLESGVEFRPQAQLTCAEAAVMLQNILQLPQNDTQAVSAMECESAVPTWAAGSVAALNRAGISLRCLDGDAVLTRREAASVLYQVEQLLQQDALPTFYWVQ